MFFHNVGGIDRVLRLTLGGILFLGGLLLLSGRTRLGATLAVVGLLALRLALYGSVCCTFRLASQPYNWEDHLSTRFAAVPHG